MIQSEHILTHIFTIDKTDVNICVNVKTSHLLCNVITKKICCILYNLRLNEKLNSTCKLKFHTED